MRKVMENQMITPGPLRGVTYYIGAYSGITESPVKKMEHEMETRPILGFRVLEQQRCSDPPWVRYCQVCFSIIPLEELDPSRTGWIPYRA